jgi:hypothetical protein
VGRNPSDALHNYIRPLEEALHCITEAPLAHRGTRNLELGKVYTASLGVDAAVRLKGAPLTFFASQSFKVIADQTGLERGNWRATTVGYVYRFNESRGKQQEVLSFHWNPRRSHTWNDQISSFTYRSGVAWGSYCGAPEGPSPRAHPDRTSFARSNRAAGDHGIRRDSDQSRLGSIVGTERRGVPQESNTLGSLAQISICTTNRTTKEHEIPRLRSE